MIDRAGRFAPLLGGYMGQAGPPKTIVVPKASRLAGIQHVTVTGTLLKNQVVRLDPKTGTRQWAQTKDSGRYTIGDADSFQFCLGVRQLGPHIVCKFQNGAAWPLLFNQSVGEKIVVSGFLRSSFAEAGFRQIDDAHIFEIDPVRAVNIGGEFYSFDVGPPPVAHIVEWADTLQERESRMRVQYWKGSDLLVFTGIEGEGEPACVVISGRVSEVTLNASRNRAAWFTLNSVQAGRKLRVHCLQGTGAARQLRDLKSTEIAVIGLRSLDLTEALKDRYVVDVLAIEILAR